jgi:uncharacterized protein (TIGR00661 family)
MAVLPQLADCHELLILAGGDAYQALQANYPITAIPTLKYHYNKRGKLSNYLNIKRNISMVLDLFLQGPAMDMVIDALRQFKPDVVVTDSEAFTHRAAQRLGIPRISLDHFGLLVYCRPEMSRADRLICWGNAFVYQQLFGEPQRAIVSAFFDAPARRAGVSVVGPVIRKEVLQAQPSRGQHLLVYINKGEYEFTPQIERSLLTLDCPVRIYGVPGRNQQDNLQFKPIDNRAFIEDLASCRAVFATTGNQLCGEVLYFGKPLLGMPMACLEQRLNAVQIERMGVGMQVKRHQVTSQVFQTFLAREDEFRNNISQKTRNGAREAFEAIEQFATELISL